VVKQLITVKKKCPYLKKSCQTIDIYPPICTKTKAGG
jgi:hypothetical protein